MLYKIKKVLNIFQNKKIKKKKLLDLIHLKFLLKIRGFKH